MAGVTQGNLVLAGSKVTMTSPLAEKETEQLQINITMLKVEYTILIPIKTHNVKIVQ